jgi:hypothetical protein
MKVSSPRALIPVAALLALGACADTMPSGSTSVTTSQPVVRSGPATTTTSTTVTTTPGTTTVVTPGMLVAAAPPASISYQVMGNDLSQANASAARYCEQNGAAAQLQGVQPGGAGNLVTYACRPYYGSSSSTGAQTTTTTVVTARARLTANEILALLADNTAAGVATQGQPYFAWFVHDGRLKYRQGEYRDGGSWRVVSDGQLCSTLTRINVGIEQCYALYREGTNIRFDRPDGNKIGTFTVEPGNPQNL